MVNTTLPANIGSAARAMHTMGLSELVVVEPKLPIDDTAVAHAAGANEILANARIVATLEEAIADCHWVFATSSRQRHIPKPVLTPRQAAEVCLKAYRELVFEPLANQQPLNIALVFGREDRGLTNDELTLADYHIQIPANPDYSVLNVAAAVQVIASVFYDMAETAFNPSMNRHNLPNVVTLDMPLRQQWDEPPITHEQQHQLQQRLLQLLEQLGIYTPEQSKALPQRVSRLLGRLQLDVKEYQLLQALVAKLARNAR